MKYENRNSPRREDMFLLGMGSRTHVTGKWKGRYWGSQEHMRKAGNRDEGDLGRGGSTNIMYMA